MAVKVNIFLVHETDFAAMNKVYETFFADPKPVRIPFPRTYSVENTRGNRFVAETRTTGSDVCICQGTTAGDGC